MLSSKPCDECQKQLSELAKSIFKKHFLEEAKLGEKTVQNTDKELWKEDPLDVYSPSLHVTKDGMIGISVGGTVYVKKLRSWHDLADRDLAETLSDEPKTNIELDKANMRLDQYEQAIMQRDRELVEKERVICVLKQALKVL
jgi:hypothetical protein